MDPKGRIWSTRCFRLASCSAGSGDKRRCGDARLWDWDRRVETQQDCQIAMDDRRWSIPKDVQVVQTLSMVVVSDGADAGATARSGMFGAEM